MDVDEPDEAEGRAGRASYRVEERTLTITGISGPVRIAAFRGAGTATSALGPALAGVKEHDPDLVFVLGALGPDLASVRAHLTALGTLGRVVVVLPGGDDVGAAVRDAFAADHPATVVDGSGLRAVAVGEARFVLLAGAPDGRYAATDAHCGNTAGDREDLVAGAATYLVSWAAPAGGSRTAVGRGFGGIEAGDPRIAALADRLAEGGAGGLFAFPGTRPLAPATPAGEPVEPGTAHARLRVVVPRVAGETDERDDLSLAPTGAALFEVRGRELVFTGASAGSTP